MTDRGVAADERGEFSETAAVGVLVGLTLVMTVGAGLFVVLSGAGNDVSATFEYQYDGDADALIVRYTEGTELTAGNVTIESDGTAVRWHQVGFVGESETLEPGASARLSESSPWGRPVTEVSTVTVYLTRDANRRQLSNWTAGM